MLLAFISDGDVGAEGQSGYEAGTCLRQQKCAALGGDGLVKVNFQSSSHHVIYILEKSLFLCASALTVLELCLTFPELSQYGTVTTVHHS